MWKIGESELYSPMFRNSSCGFPVFKIVGYMLFCFSAKGRKISVGLRYDWFGIVVNYLLSRRSCRRTDGAVCSVSLHIYSATPKPPRRKCHDLHFCGQNRKRERAQPVWCYVKNLESSRCVLLSKYKFSTQTLESLLLTPPSWQKSKSETWDDMFWPLLSWFETYLRRCSLYRLFS